MRRVAFLVLRILCVSVVAFTTEAQRPQRILFVGNSLTFANDLPAMVRRIGDIAGTKIRTETVALPNFSLEDHLANRQSRNKLQRGEWDIAVLQQGPSSLDESRRQFIHDVTEIRRLVPEGRDLAVLMVWPDRTRFRFFDRVIESYRLAAEAAGGTVIPAGESIREGVEKNLPLLDADGYHPTPAGTFLAALVVYRTLIGELPKGVERAGGGVGLTAEQLRQLIQIAKK